MKKVHLKSIFSMLLRLGVFQPGAQPPPKVKPKPQPQPQPSQFGASTSEPPKPKPPDAKSGSDMPAGTENQESKGQLGNSSDKAVDYVKLARNLLKKALSLTGCCYLPRLTKGYDPILSSAEKILVQSKFIKRTRKYRLPEARGNNKPASYAPRVDLAKLSKQLNL